MAYYLGAVVCTKGHCFNAWLRPGENYDKRCKECGADNIVQCTQCGAPLRGMPPGYYRGDMNQNVGNYCWECGGPYPWRERRLAELQKMLELRCEIEDWDEATKERLRELSGEVASGSASADYVLTVATWLEQRAGPAAKNAVWEIVKGVGTDLLVGAVKNYFGIRP